MSGLLVLDISDPANPAPVGSVGGEVEKARDVAIAGDLACVVDNDHGLVLVDISDPANPAVITYYDIGILPQSVAVAGDHAFVGYNESQFRVWQIFNRTVDQTEGWGYSLRVNDSGTSIIAMRCKSTQVGNVSWWLSGRGGQNWLPFHPSQWRFVYPYEHGSNLRWRSRHRYSAGSPMVNPTCTNLEIDWRYMFPVMDFHRGRSRRSGPADPAAVDRQWL